MIFLDWNMGWSASIARAIAGIQSLIEGKRFIITLQEIDKAKSQAIKCAFSDIAYMEYSLNYRARGKREPRSRELGIMILTSKDIEIIDADVLENTLLPERTLVVKVKIANTEIKIISLHSITGCDYKKAKSLQFYAFADAIDRYQPTIVSFDANEPQIDAPSVQGMSFYNNKDNGKGANTFFESLVDNGLTDSFIHSFDGNYAVNQPLAISHEMNKSKGVRYDFIFVDEKKIDVKSVEYKLQEAKAASGDHAFVLMNFELKTMPLTTEIQ